MTRVKWQTLMRAGIGGLALRPAEFWALTPAELMLMLGDGPAAPPMNRSRLEDLIAAFPDLTQPKTQESPDG